MNDYEILRDLASAVAEAAALPIQAEKRRLWRKLNALNPERPMVMIDQVCWHEMNFDGSLTLQCTQPRLRHYERTLRRILFQWKHFPVDRPVEATLDVPMAIEDSGFGIKIIEEVAYTNQANDVKSHAYSNQLAHDEDIEKIVMPSITHDAAESARRLDEAQSIFGGILTPQLRGLDPYLSVWDPIAQWMGMEALLYGLADRPEFMRAVADRMVTGYLSKLDQLEAQGLLYGPQPLIHCTGAYTDALPAPGYDPVAPRTQDMWMFGLAQPFSDVSPAMFEDFEIEPCLPLFARFGMVYYGCCDPLDRKMAQVRRIPNVRKISMSPWANEARGAAEIGREYVYSKKPNPAQLAFESFEPEAVRAHLEATIDACRPHGCPIELILKDISTVRNDPKRLLEWARIAMDVAQS